MKKIIVAVAFVATSLLANAQGGAVKQTAAQQQQMPDASTRANNATERMTKALELTEAQKPKVLNINLEKAKAMDANRQKNSTDAKALETEKQIVITKWETNLKGVLTADQMTKFKKMESDQAAKENTAKKGTKDAK
jgi:protein CpxP